MEERILTMMMPPSGETLKVLSFMEPRRAQRALKQKIWNLDGDYVGAGTGER